MFCSTLKGLARVARENLSLDAWPRERLRRYLRSLESYQGLHPGLELANAFGVSTPALPNLFSHREKLLLESI